MAGKLVALTTAERKFQVDGPWGEKFDTGKNTLVYSTSRAIRGWGSSSRIVQLFIIPRCICSDIFEVLSKRDVRLLCVPSSLASRYARRRRRSRATPQKVFVM